MKRYAAFLRGVTPMNARMPELKRAVEEGGFAEVATVLSSGNVVFSARPASEASIERRVETAIGNRLGRTFLAIVRPVDALRDMIDADAYAAFRLAPASKRVVTFLRQAPRSNLSLPIELDGARILCRKGREVYSAYVPSPRGPVFMTLLARTFGEDITTRTWDTIKKVVKAGGEAPAAGASRTRRPRR